MKKLNFAKLIDLGLIVSAAMLILMIVVLTIQNNSLKSEVTSLKRQISLEEVIKPGDLIEPFTAINAVNGELVNINQYADNGILLIFLGLDCKFCKEDLPLWRQIESTNTVSLVGITIGSEVDAIIQYASINKITFPIILDNDKSIFESLKIPGTPVKILLNNNLQVEYVWIGVTSQDSSTDDLAALEKYWHIDRKSLPSSNAFQLQQ